MKNSLKLLALYPDLRVRMTVRSTEVENLSKNIIYLVEKGFNLIVPVLDFYDKNWNEDAFCTLWRSQMRFRAVALRSITAARF